MKWKTCNKEKEKDVGGKLATVAMSPSAAVCTTEKKQSVSDCESENLQHKMYLRFFLKINGSSLSN